MNLPSSESILTISEVLSAIGGLIYAIIKIIRQYKNFHRSKNENLLLEARNYTDHVKIELEGKIASLLAEIHLLEDNVKKDIDHVKEVQTNEIRNLSDKVESLRSELHEGHSQLITLLTRLIEKS